MGLLRRKPPSNMARAIGVARAVGRTVRTGSAVRGAAAGAATLVGLTTVSAVVSTVRDRAGGEGGGGAEQ